MCMSQVRTLDETIIGLVDHTSRVLACRIVSVVGKSPSEAVQQRDPPEAHQSIMSSRRCRRTFEVREHSLPALFLPLFRRGLGGLALLRLAVRTERVRGRWRGVGQGGSYLLLITVYRASRVPGPGLFSFVWWSLLLACSLAPLLSHRVRGARH